jgi:hypothetical protein
VRRGPQPAEVHSAACQVFQEKDMTKTTPEQNKALVLKAFDTLFNKRDYEAAAPFLVRELHPAQRPYRARPRRLVQADPRRA